MLSLGSARARYNVGVNAVAPGKTVEVAAMAAFLVLEKARRTHAQNVFIDGGL